MIIINILAIILININSYLAKYKYKTNKKYLKMYLKNIEIDFNNI